MVTADSEHSWVFSQFLDLSLLGDAHASPACNFGDNTTLAVTSAGSEAVLIFRLRASRSWEASQRLTSPDTFSRTGFGTSLAFNRDRLAVGAPLLSAGTTSETHGRVFIFRRPSLDEDFLLVSTLTPPSPWCHQTDARFGAPLALRGDRLVVGLVRGVEPRIATALVFAKKIHGLSLVGSIGIEACLLDFRHWPVRGAIDLTPHRVDHDCLQFALTREHFLAGPTLNDSSSIALLFTIPKNDVEGNQLALRLGLSSDEAMAAQGHDTPWRLAAFSAPTDESVNGSLPINLLIAGSSCNHPPCPFFTWRGL